MKVKTSLVREDDEVYIWYNYVIRGILGGDNMEFKHLKNKFDSWEELEEYIKSLKIAKDKGDAFEEFAYLYFLSNKDLYNIKEIYPENEIPDVLKDKYKLENTDYGVDGLIITNNDESIGYQVKFRSDNSTATYSELSTFWAESEYCDKRCIFSNCLQLPFQSEKKKNQFQILLDTFLTLPHDFFEEIYCIANAKPIKVKEKHKPKEHQSIIIKDVLKGFETNKRGKIICACGTGKTLTALWIKEKMNAKKTLFVVPSLALIRQTLVEWKKQANVAFEHLVVCSDKTVNENDGTINLEHTSSSNIPVTTDSEEIKKFLNNDNNQVVFSTYQSLDEVAAALIDMDFSFDLTIFDEAHRTAGTNDSKMFSLGLKDEFIKSDKRLFMTATERIVSPRVKKLALESDYTIFSMDDEEVYGPVFSRLDFGKAIEKGIISDYKVILAAVNSSQMLEQIGSKNLFTTNGDD
ncbi:MAG: DEAD/DEAH box helicase family protein, partial [Bacilli bacterium]|nr:DEAD/DEAH box helicase family protein [Bacilli bacterium]